MANPQAENGHVDISNEVMDALISNRVSGEEMQCLLFIIRKTWGWKKKEDKISLSQFVEATGINKQNVYRALNKLSSKKMIAIIKNDYENVNSYCFIKDFDKWVPSSKKITPSSKLIKGVIKIDKRPSSKMINTKDNYTKDTTTKDKVHSDFVLFWNAYPKKIGKLAALKSWKKNGRPDIRVILDAISKQRASPGWLKDGGQYIPNPSTWLDQGRWDDEVDTKPQDVFDQLKEKWRKEDAENGKQGTDSRPN